MRFIALFLITMLSSGCATIFNSGSQQVRVEADKNASVKISIDDGGNAPVPSALPVNVTLLPSSLRDITVEVTDPCYVPERSTLEKHVTPVYWLNLFNLYGLGIDYLTGHMWDYDPLVVLSVKRREDHDSSCDYATATHTESIALTGKHLVGFGIMMPGVLERSTLALGNNMGVYLEFGRRLTPDLWLNLRLSNSSYYVYDCNETPFCSDYNSQQNVIALSLRQYLAPTTNLYAGLGAAAVFFDQFYSVYNDFIYSGPKEPMPISVYEPPVMTSGSYPATFLEVGWQARKGRVPLNISAIVDFSDLHFAINNHDRNKALTSAKNARHRQLMRSSYSMGGVSIGLNYPF